MTGKNRIIVYGPKDEGTYVIEFRTSEGETHINPEVSSDPAFSGADALWAVRAGRTLTEKRCHRNQSLLVRLNRHHHHRLSHYHLSTPSPRPDLCPRQAGRSRKAIGWRPPCLQYMLTPPTAGRWTRIGG
jgi:hypothetical protein